MKNAMDKTFDDLLEMAGVAKPTFKDVKRGDVIRVLNFYDGSHFNAIALDDATLDPNYDDETYVVSFVTAHATQSHNGWEHFALWNDKEWESGESC